MFTTSPMKQRQTEMHTYAAQMRMGGSSKTHRLRKSFDVTTRHSMGSSNRANAKGFYENSFMKQAVKFHQTPESIFSHKQVMSQTLNGFKTVRLQNEQDKQQRNNMTVNQAADGQMFYRTAKVQNYEPNQSQGSAGEVIANINTNPGLNRNQSDNNIKQSQAPQQEFIHAINPSHPVLTREGSGDPQIDLTQIVSQSGKGDRVEIIDAQRIDQGFQTTHNTLQNDRPLITKTQPEDVYDVTPQVFGGAANQDIRIKLWGHNSKHIQQGMPHSVKLSNAQSSSKEQARRNRNNGIMTAQDHRQNRHIRYLSQCRQNTKDAAEGYLKNAAEKQKPSQVGAIAFKQVHLSANGKRMVNEYPGNKSGDLNLTVKGSPDRHIRHKSQVSKSFACDDARVTHRNAATLYGTSTKWAEMVAKPEVKRPIDMISHAVSSIYRTRVDGKPQDGCFREKAVHSALNKTPRHSSMKQHDQVAAGGRAHQTVGHNLAQNASHARKFMLSDFWHQNDSNHFDKKYANGLAHNPRGYHQQKTEITTILSAYKSTNPIICTR